jgi:hypothetical protein
MSAWYLSLSGILRPFQRRIQREKTLKMAPKRYTKPSICVCRIETGKGANYAENEQEAPVGVVFLLK